jgi:malate synthase
VDAQDKLLAYRNWLGILQGTLTEQVSKGRQELHARPQSRPQVQEPEGRRRGAPACRSLLFLRNVGHLMTNPAILWDGGKEIYGGIMDAVSPPAIAMLDLQGKGANGIRNSRTGSVYIVKPKMHGPPKLASRPSCSARGAAAGPGRQHR